MATAYLDDTAITLYEHHGTEVAVMERNRGRHRDNCLCHVCPLFRPGDREENCEIANALYRFDILAGVTTPVWECEKLARWIVANQTVLSVAEGPRESVTVTTGDRT